MYLLLKSGQFSVVFLFSLSVCSGFLYIKKSFQELLSQKCTPSIFPYQSPSETDNTLLCTLPKSLALVGRKVPLHARGVFLTSRAGGWENRWSQPAHRTFHRLPWASPGRCTCVGGPASHLPSLPPTIQATMSLCWAVAEQ